MKKKVDFLFFWWYHIDVSSRLARSRPGGSRGDEEECMNDVAKNTLMATAGNVQSAIDALCDGEYLAGAGYSNEDQASIEEAVEELRQVLKLT